MPHQEFVGRANQGASHHTCLVKELGVDGHFNLAGSVAQTCYLLMHVVATLAVLLDLADGLADAPQFRIFGMTLKLALVGEREHLVVHSRGVANAKDGHTMIHEFFANPIDRHVALSAHEHLCFTMQRLVDGFNQCGCLSCSGRSMHHFHILCPQHLVHCLFLCLVQPRECDGREGALLWFQLSCKDILQVCQTIVLRIDSIIKCMKHSLIRCFIKVKLQAKIGRILQVDECLRRG